MRERIKNKIRVLLADDHPAVRVGIRRYLMRSKNIEVIGEAQNGRQALKMAQELEPDILLLDVEMPDLKGYEIVQQLSDLNSSVKTLALSAYDEKRYIVGMLTSGAAGYLTKEEAPGKLIEAINEVAKGKKGWISPRVAERLGMPNPPTGRKSIPRLTSKELDVLARIADGDTDQQIAVALDMDINSVHTLVEAITTKLGTYSRLDAALRAIREGLI